jgi:hypothetical protein
MLGYQGAVIEEIRLPDLDTLSYCTNLMIGVEAAAYHHRRFEARPDDFGPTLRRVIESGRSHNAVEYVQA